MVFSAISLTAFVLSAVPAAYSYWTFEGIQPLVMTRLDPVASAGQVAPHVHTAVGGSRFQATYDFNDLVQSQCSTVPIQQDKSNYYTPSLYFLDQDQGTFTLIPTFYNIYYFSVSGPKNEKINAFPTGLKMLAGDFLRRVNNASNFADQAINFNCLDTNNNHTGDPAWADRPDFPQQQCPDGLRAQIFFPSCWDGVNLDSPDHKSHMAYPIQAYNTGDCPDTHPVHLVSLFYEIVARVDLFPYSPGSWVFSFGDETGLGLHADFQDGWEDKSVLQSAIDNCSGSDGNLADCAPLSPLVNNTAALACTPEMTIPDENVGFTSTLTDLPGCNPIWVGTGPKPTCDPNPPTPSFVPAESLLAPGWFQLGYIAEGTTGRAFTSASTTDPAMVL